MASPSNKNNAAFQPALPICQSLLFSSSTTSFPFSTTNPTLSTRRKYITPNKSFSPALAQTTPSPSSPQSQPQSIPIQSTTPTSSTSTNSTPATTNQRQRQQTQLPPPEPYPIQTPYPYPTPSSETGNLAALSRDSKTIPEFFHTLSKSLPSDLIALNDSHHEDQPVMLTHPQVQSNVLSFAKGLQTMGLQQGDVVSFFSESSYRWFITDLSIMAAGCASAVRGTAAPPSELLYILKHSNSRALFIENRQALNILLSNDQSNTLDGIDFIVLLYGSSTEGSSDLNKFNKSHIKMYAYDEILSIGQQEQKSSPDFQFVGTRSDMATVLYTSGTTGNPKGVVLTHDNLLRQLEHISLGEKSDPKIGEVFVSILPIWHVFERTAAYWCLSRGMTLVYSNKKHFKSDLLLHRPHMLIAVPRVFDSLHSTIMTKLRKASKLRRAIFHFFSMVTLSFIHQRRHLQNLNLTSSSPAKKLIAAFQMALLFPLWILAHALIWKKIRAGLGGRLKTVLSGGGSIAMYLEDFFESSGINIYVGYGLTETSPVIANRFSDRNVKGSTGLPLQGNHVKLINTKTGAVVTQPYEQGALFVRGPSVFSGYLNNEEATSKVFDDDGYFDTGDIAYLSNHGDIVICGRQKDVIVLSNGENIEPTPIEDSILASALIDQIMLVGQDERHLGALVVPQLEEFVAQDIISGEEAAAVAKDAENSVKRLESNHDFMQALKSEIRSRNEERESYSSNDKVVAIHLMLTPFSVENGMMTQTMKLKKDVIQNKYKDLIQQMYH